MTDPDARSSPLPYGPSTTPIRKFLQRLAALDPLSEKQVVDRYRALAATARFRAAELALGVAVERSGREREQAALAGPLLQLMRGGGLGDNGGRSVASADAASANIESDASPTSESRSNGDSLHDDELLRPIAEPALAALLGLMMRDVLDARDVDSLYEPFADTVPRVRLD